MNPEQYKLDLRFLRGQLCECDHMMQLHRKEENFFPLGLMSPCLNYTCKCIKFEPMTNLRYLILREKLNEESKV